MYYQLNLNLKNFGLNTRPYVTFQVDTLEDVKKILKGYQPLLVNYKLYKFEFEYPSDGTFITKRTEINKLI